MDDDLSQRLLEFSSDQLAEELGKRHVVSAFIGHYINEKGEINSMWRWRGDNDCAAGLCTQLHEKITRDSILKSKP